MIEGYVGLPGAGKSAHGVLSLIEARRKGRSTIANFHSRSGMWEFGLWADFVEAGNCLAVIDEAHMWFSARSWTKTQQLELSVFQQSRKEGLDLVWIAQSAARVDTAIREVTAFVWTHKMIGRFCWARQYVLEDIDKQKRRSLRSRIFRVGPQITKHYFTEERIGDREGNGYRLGGTTAYRRDAVVPVIGDGCRLIPNWVRIEFPTTTLWREATDPSVDALTDAAYKEWAMFGRPRDPGDLCRGFYRDGEGGFTEITPEGRAVIAPYRHESAFEVWANEIGRRLDRAGLIQHSAQVYTVGQR